jgi:outer membrane protein TolC
MKATQVIALYVKIEDLQNENLRVSEILFSTGKATHDVVFRARAELSRTEQEKLNVENLQKQSRSYFNFVLNRPLNSTIEPFNPDTFLLLIIPEFESAKHEAFMNREELLQIKNVIAASDNSAAIARSRYFPGINAVVDYGFQGEEYRFTDHDDFWMASVALEWNLFNGLQDKAKLEQAKLETRKMQTKEEELKRQIELEIERIYDNLIVARKTINVTKKQIESADASFKIVRKKYEEGVAAQVEYLDAQTTLTNATINAIITKYDFFIIYAEFEKITARYQLENNN